MKKSLLLLLYLGTVSIAQDKDAVDRKKRLAQMRGLAAATRVVQLIDERPVSSQLVTEPLFRYRDEPRGILDATLWAYGNRGRPSALQKIELYRDTEKPFFCMTSLSEPLIEANWHDGQQWPSKRPGIKFQTLKNGPKASDSKRRRLIQVKLIADRFDAELFNPTTKQEAKMRRLPRPIYRYDEADERIVDGAIFGYATYGTNPDLLLCIELQRDENGTIWKYGCARMTLYKVMINHDKRTVWEAPFVAPQGPGRASKFDNWLFFHENAR